MFRRIVLTAAFSLTSLLAHAQSETDFGALPIGSSSPSTVTLTLPNAATLAIIAVVTQGAPALDFTDLGTGTCKAGTAYTAGQTCTVAVRFSPAAAGQRLGQVLLEDASGNVLTHAYLAGIGQGPQLAYGPGVALAIAPTVAGAGLLAPSGVAVDGFGTLYVADDNNNRVVEIPANGAAPTAIDPVVAGSGFRTPRGVAIDAAGNLYVSDLDSNRILEVPTNAAAIAIATDPIVNGIGLHYPCGLVVDPAGNLYIADVDNARVLEVPANGGPVLLIDPEVNGKSLNYPVTLALDAAGDLFIADLFNNQVVEVPVNGGAAIAINPIVNGIGLDQPYGIAVDAAGDLLIADSGNNRMVEVPGNGSPAFAFVPTVNGKAIDDPIGIALDSAGNLFIADSNNNRVVELQRAQPPTLSFAATPIGTPGSDSPQTLQLLNLGNQPLSFAVPASGNNPAITSGFTLASGAASECALLTPASTAETLAAGASCNLPISFVPTSPGSVAGALTLVDNNLNRANATQTVPLVGASPVAALSVKTLGFGLQALGSPSTSQPITLTNSGGAALAISSIAVTGSGAPSFAITNPCGTTLAAGASCTLQVVFTPAAAGPLTAAVAFADNAAASPQSVSLTGTGAYLPSVTVSPSSSAITTLQPLAVAITVATAATAEVPTGSVTLQSGAYTSASASLSAGSATVTLPAGSLAAGTDTLVAAYSPDAASASIYLANTGSASVAVTAAVAPTASAPSVVASPPTGVTYSAATLAGTVNPNGADTHFWFLYGTSSTLAGATQTPSQDLGSGTSITAATATLTGLTPTTLYYYQLIAQNSVGATHSPIGSFTTIGAPYITLNGTALTLTPGATTGNTSTIDIVPWNGFTGTVALSCQVSTAITNDTDLPTCSLQPASVTIASANSTQATLTIDTTAPVASNRSPFLWPAAGGAILSCLLLFVSPPRSRRRTPLFLVFLFGILSASFGCSASSTGGGGSAPPPAVPGTTPGAYTITISGTSGSSTVSTSIPLTVQ